MSDYSNHDRAVWERIFAAIPPEWYKAPPSDAMQECRAYFAANRCRRVLDVGCGFGRWAEFLAGQHVQEIIGVDYAKNGVLAAAEWARRASFRGKFVVASASALPFKARQFDGVLAALLLDNLSRSDCVRTVHELGAVLKPGAHGFFVFNPCVTVAESVIVEENNPTKACMHVVYEDDELPRCLPGWAVTRVGSSAERFRVIEATFQGDDDFRGAA